MIKTKKRIIISFILTLALSIGALILLGGAHNAEAVTTIPKPERDTTSFVYNGEEQTYRVAESEYYKVENNVGINAGSQNVKISLVDKINYAWDDGTTDDIIYKFTIEKARYSMLGVEFKNKTVVADGNEYSLQIKGALPEGITVSYSSNNLQSKEGSYQISADFSGENENYHKISSMYATLTIRQPSVSGALDKDGENTVTVTSPIGIAPNLTLSITEKNYSKSPELVKRLGDNESLYNTYDIKLVKNNVPRQPDTEVEITIKLPNEIKGKNIRIINFKPTGEIEELELTKEKGKVTFKTDDLYDFAIIYDNPPVFLWALVALVGGSVIIVGGVIFVMMIRASKKSKANDEEEPIKGDK